VPDLWDVTFERLSDLGIDRVDLLTAGIPCQPHSLAGKRQATEDKRELSEGMLSAVRAMAQTSPPKIIVVENVLGFAADGDVEHDGGIDELCMALERLAYETRPLVLPASAVGASHRRDRVFLVATSRALADAHRVATRSKMAQHADGGRPLVPASPLTGFAGGSRSPVALRAPWNRPDEPVWRPSGDEIGRDEGEDKSEVRGGLYGLSPGLDRADARRLKALGNAVVPAHALPVLRAARSVLEVSSTIAKEAIS
jgi:DNA (cytosine-5)-methyltransferase 1